MKEEVWLCYSTCQAKTITVCLCKNENGYSYNFSICEGIKNSYSEHRISHDIYLVKHIISLLITVALQEEQKLCCQKVGTKLMSC